jgi:hypothetical protein
VRITRPSASITTFGSNAWLMSILADRLAMLVEPAC